MTHVQQLLGHSAPIGEYVTVHYPHHPLLEARETSGRRSSQGGAVAHIETTPGNVIVSLPLTPFWWGHSGIPSAIRSGVGRGLVGRDQRFHADGAFTPSRRVVPDCKELWRMARRPGGRQLYSADCEPFSEAGSDAISLLPDFVGS